MGFGAAEQASMVPDMMVNNDDNDMKCLVESEEKTALAKDAALIYNVNRAPAPVAAVAVGAGAEIDQELKNDPLSPDEWKSEPSGVIRLYFVFREQFEQIYKKGIKDLKGRKEGYLKGVPVG